MPGYYETCWDAAKTDFEKESGKIIAKVYEMQLKTSKKKVAGLKDEKTEAPRLKKPAASGWFGRKSSGMEPACKALDKASDAKKASEKDKKKAYDDYEKAAKKYEKELRDSVKDESKPYMHVQQQIKILEEKMWEILEGFRANHLSDEDALFGHLDQNNNLLEKELAEMSEMFKELWAEFHKGDLSRGRAFNETDCDRLNPIFEKVIKQWLQKLDHVEKIASQSSIKHGPVGGLRKFLEQQLDKPFTVGGDGRKPSYGDEIRNKWFSDLNSELIAYRRPFKQK